MGGPRRTSTDPPTCVLVPGHLLSQSNGVVMAPSFRPLAFSARLNTICLSVYMSLSLCVGLCPEMPKSARERGIEPRGVGPGGRDKDSEASTNQNPAACDAGGRAKFPKPQSPVAENMNHMVKWPHPLTPHLQKQALTTLKYSVHGCGTLFS